MRSLKIIFACIVLILLLACVESTELPLSGSSEFIDPPEPLTAQAVLAADNNLIIEIIGMIDRPGYVYAEYWVGSTHRWRTKIVAAKGENYSIYVVRLRAETEYNFQVFGTNLAGNIFDGPVGTFSTGDLPSGLQDAKFDVLAGTPTHDLTYMEFRQKSFKGLAAIDPDGYIVWYYPALPGEEPYVMARRENGNIVYLAGGKRVVAEGLVEINWLGDEQYRLEDICSPNGPIHHEIELLNDGRVMYLSRDVLRPGFGNPPVPQEGDTIGIWNPQDGSNQIVWNIFDFISPDNRISPDSDSTLPDQFMWGGCDRDDTVQDWSHGNSVNMALDGTVVISLRHLDQIVAIDQDFKSVQWRLGGPGSDFEFRNPEDRFYHQHTASLLPNGNVLLFDNGNDRPVGEGGEYSRALELELDFDTMTVSKIWEFRNQPDIFSDCCSIVHRLENGNSLILFGINSDPVCCRPFIIVETNPSGEIVWLVDHRSPGKFSQYRIYPSDSIMGEVKVINK